jgi:hypothetical protein
MFKNFLMKQMLKRQMKDVPAEEQEKVFAMVEKNPDFFQNIAAEIKLKMDSGMDQMKATMEVVQKHQAELKNIMGTPDKK